MAEPQRGTPHLSDQSLRGHGNLYEIAWTSLGITHCHDHRQEGFPDMSRHSAAPRGAAGQVVLTRQGISLKTLLPVVPEADSAPCYHVVPACRHADGTISSSSVLDVRRMASEDSEEFRPGL